MFKKKEESKTYSILLECDNCQEENELYIPFGVIARHFAERQRCTECGCMLILKDEEILFEKSSEE